ncbi:1-phosphatidylinositol phosphodiesterase precursor [Trichoderma arundinaceum]|uniref:1-phosphatidylinositol phosphodiesterase n=1 Tax=Trichoderma arundinaceum TaxID=490622 RepID=A0A395NN35_TRIAR|nr:1-phosphatidylinositol phosphodiesterase precursor [Trichoderma arundinaceum]
MGAISLPIKPAPRSRRRQLPALIVICAIGAMALFYMLLSIAPCMVGATCYRGYQSFYSFDAGDELHPRWMAKIPDGVHITSLSIPGTHDTMTYNIGSEQLQCQNWNLSMQLQSGLRYLDIRARLRDDELHIYHANGYTGFSYEQVLLDVFAFLDANPSEAVIMRLKEEGGRIGTNNTISFEDAFNYHHYSSPITAPGAAKHIHKYDFAAPIPTLGELRSKIFILQNFDARDGPYGLRWEGPEMVLEDLWVIPDVYHLSEKWTAIRDALEYAALAPDDNRFLYLAHTSASVGVLPIEAAAGPMNRTIPGMNDMTGQYLEDASGNDDLARIGVVIIDFPGRKLIKTILNWNVWLRKA